MGIRSRGKGTRLEPEHKDRIPALCLPESLKMRPSSGPCKMSIETLTLSASLGGFKAQTNREGVSNTGCPVTPTAYAEDHDTDICERAESGRRA